MLEIMFKGLLGLIGFLANPVLKSIMDEISRSEDVTFLFPLIIRYPWDIINIFNEN